MSQSTESPDNALPPHQQPYFGKIVRFVPTEASPNYPGVNGFGIENDQFRFVMYGPQSTEPTTGKKGDHPPAHIHAIHMESKRDFRFQLVESKDGASVEPIAYDGKNRLILKDSKEGQHPEIEIARATLNADAELFVQLWRELYYGEKSNDISGHVTRRDDHSFTGRAKHPLVETKRRNGYYYTDAADGIKPEPPSVSPRKKKVQAPLDDGPAWTEDDDPPRPKLKIPKPPKVKISRPETIIPSPPRLTFYEWLCSSRIKTPNYTPLVDQFSKESFIACPEGGELSLFVPKGNALASVVKDILQFSWGLTDAQKDTIKDTPPKDPRYPLVRGMLQFPITASEQFTNSELASSLSEKFSIPVFNDGRETPIQEIREYKSDQAQKREKERQEHSRKP